jgi:FkbH-like protein
MEAIQLREHDRTFKENLDEPALRALEDTADALASSDRALADKVARSLALGNLSAAKWLRAALLDQLGQHGEAAREFEAIPQTQSAEVDAARLTALSRACLAAGDWKKAAWALRDSTRMGTSYRLLATNARLLTRLEREYKPLLAKSAIRRTCRLALLGDATFDLLAPILRIIAFASGIDLSIHCGSYGQHVQEILDPASPLQSFRPEIVLLATGWRSLGLPEESRDSDTAVTRAVFELQALWRYCRDRYGAFVIQHNFEVPEPTPYGRLSAMLANGRARLLQRINLGLAEAAAIEPGVAVLDMEQIAGAFGKRRWERPAEWQIARQYPSAMALPELARHQVALVRAVLGLSYKALALDLDGVLWGGVVGEDGVAGIILGGSSPGEAYREFQRYVKTLGERGVLLAVCSKNNDGDARAPFLSHPERVLGLDDFAVFVANWEPKDENLRRIATDLHIGLDSIVFLDDNPIERDLIRRRLPEVEVPEWPIEPAEFLHALDRGRYFEALALTAEDRGRSGSVRTNSARETLRETSGTLEEFLRALEMEIDLRPFEEADVPRILQLIHKTNQFNLTSRRHTEAEVRHLADTAGTYTQALRLRDRFGDSGLVGALIAVRQGDALLVDTWVLSCRVLGRRVPEASFAALCQYAAATGCRSLLGEYHPTPGNALVAEFFGQIGFACIETSPTGVRRYRREVPDGAVFPECFEVQNRTQLAPASRAALR